ncbi:hypothetical protein GlitD10_0490 [Gloeomargarita lithophora Alchichica-D10]|uniref:Uncharacterized protein n=1 Tax=Gloeomargarita lithophora Alchichica-D10 TaxID=1188229 RepID=A0A1J0AA42_9CYAN|nr:hypothetical protein [Gloeomargarita lithophora]APB32802.1 hypothetical protein GlitD10_0490 [Gloeomargarita lithophora Alchichica-D10]
MIHDFNESLKKSQDPQYETFWQECYKQEFGDQLTAAFSTGSLPSEWQRAGIDRLVLTKSGNTYYVDEKLRDNDWGDFLIEYASVAHRSGNGWRVEKPGWAIDPQKRCDFILYGIPTVEKYWFLPYHALRNAVGGNLAEWKTRYRVISATNQKYHSLSIPVPWDVFFSALVSTMKHDLRIAKTPTVKKLLSRRSKGGAAA